MKRRTRFWMMGAILAMTPSVWADDFPALLPEDDATEVALLPASTDEESVTVSDDESPQGIIQAVPVDEDAAPLLDSEIEVVIERYPNHKPKVRREVALDAQQNYVNHGNWTMWDEEGNVLAQGTFNAGKREGKWIRVHANINDLPFAKGFQAPVMSEAIFSKGEISGTWTLVDAKQRQIRSLEFNDGKLDGTAIWWHANGQVKTQETYIENALDGDALEWDEKGKLTSRLFYKDGKKHTPYQEKHANGQKKVEGFMLSGAEAMRVEYDWWQGSLVSEANPQTGDNLRHGTWVIYYPDGGKKFEGEFDRGEPTGKHSWWRANGQIEAEGEYVKGKQKGTWTWWHENGQKQRQGAYVLGRKSGLWREWAESGQLENSHDMPTLSEEEIAGETEQSDEHPSTALLPIIEDEGEPVMEGAIDGPDLESEGPF